MRHLSTLVIASLAVFATVSGCNCDRGLSRRGAVLVVDRTTVDFGTVQINLEHTRELMVRNDGTATMTLSEPEIGSPFSLKTELPVTIQIGGELPVTIAYRPTVANQVNEGALVFKTDDPENVTKRIELKGQGVQAVAAVTPNPIAFGDVYALENKQLTVKLTNSGTNDLVVTDVLLAPGTTAGITGDLTPLEVTLPAGGSSQTVLTFAPTDEVDVSGALRFELHPLAGGRLDVPISGRGIQAKPKACFKFQGAGTETCSNPNGSGAETLSIPFGAICDNRINVPGTDGGCTVTTGTRSGELYFRNNGNVPVKFSGTWAQNSNQRACGDAGVAPPDFTFSNAPDAGLASFATATSQLPGSVNDPRPWETAPVTVTYRAKSNCSEDSADSAQVLQLRQGEPFGTNRLPAILIVTFTGSSALPNAQKSDVTSQPSATQLPNNLPFVGVINQGNASMTVSAVNLFEELTDAGAGTGPNGGVLRSCVNAPLSSPCVRFAWLAGGDPNNNVPILIPVSDGGTTPAIGTIVFGPDGGTDCTLGVCPNQTYVIYAVIDTSDPYHPAVVTKITARAN